MYSGGLGVVRVQGGVRGDGVGRLWGRFGVINHILIEYGTVVVLAAALASVLYLWLA